MGAFFSVCKPFVKSNFEENTKQHIGRRRDDKNNKMFTVEALSQYCLVREYNGLWAWE